MRKIIISIYFIVSSFVLFGQNIINCDTTITKKLALKESFELNFEVWPSPGIMWYLPDSLQSSKLSIKLIKKELIKGQFPKGGKYIYTYSYHAFSKGDYTLEYFYGRIWIKEKMKKCIVKIIVE